MAGAHEQSCPWCLTYLFSRTFYSAPLKFWTDNKPLHSFVKVCESHAPVSLSYPCNGLFYYFQLCWERKLQTGRDALKNFYNYFSILRNISGFLLCTVFDGKKVWSKTEMAARSNIKKYVPPAHIFDAARWVSLTFREFFADFSETQVPWPSILWKNTLVKPASRHLENFMTGWDGYR